MNRVFNREMLILARESRGLTQSEFADELAKKLAMVITQATISKIENGLKEPTPEQISSFAQCLKYRKEFFYLAEQIRHFGSGCVYHRKKQRTPESKLRYLLAMINVRSIQVKTLLQSAEIETENEFPRLDVDEHGPPEKIAKTVRAMWKLPPGPVQHLTRAIEDAGGIVLRCDFETRDVDALSQLSPDVPPLFLINSSIPTDRMRWTLAHELGHIIMHTMPTDDMEKEADRFASEFLMPQDEIKPDLFGVTLPKLANLKPYWKVSMNALLKRAGDLGTISPRMRTFLWTQMGRAGYRLNEPVPLPQEEPTLIDEIITMHSNELGYSTDDLGTITYTYEDEVRALYLARKSRLRVVG
jgi:Zn-dependent peptidase ImmA (M78 family)/transcriptional regulator with XRE-family HTH domain